MAQERTVTCPGCGAAMNRHAEKLAHDPRGESASAWDAALDGVLLEFHSCPQCGAMEERPARD